MSTYRKLLYATIEQYLAFEEKAATRHEFVDGHVFAMTGVTKRHNTIALNIYSILRSHLRDSPCRAYVSDVKARVQATNSFYYPDVMVSCEQYDDQSSFSERPVLIVEVLSRSTAAIDRREKLLAYRQIETMKEYLIVHQRRKKIEMNRKQIDGFWESLEFVPGSSIVLESMPTGPLALSIEEVYQDIEWSSGGDLHIREDVAEEWLLDRETEEDEGCKW